MSVTVKFGITDKRENSTKIVSNYALSTSCILKEPTSILTPSILLQRRNNDVVNFNYMYIEEFKRYYFITETVSVTESMWEISGRVDVLATYRESIGDASLYALRCSSRYDRSLTDKLYPCTGNVNTQVGLISQTTSWTIDDDFTGGTYIVTTLGNNETSVNGQTIYALTPEQFRTVMNALLASSQNVSWSSLGQGIVNSLFNPTDYITACYWIPFVIPSGSAILTSKQFKCGLWDSGQSANIVNTTRTLVVTYNAPIPHHPDAGSNIDYRNLSPYAEYTLDMGFMPAIKLDGNLLNGESNITITMYIDLTTGIAKVRGTTHSGNAEVFSMTAQYGVPINLSSSKNNMLNMLGDALSVAVGTAIANPVMVAGAALDAGITGAEAVAGGTVSNGGGNGSLAGHQVAKRLYARFLEVVDKAPEITGLPLCRHIYPVTLEKGSFVMFDDPNLMISGILNTEIQTLKSQLRSGVYWE